MAGGWCAARELGAKRMSQNVHLKTKALAVGFALPGRARFTWEPSLDRAREAVDWMLGQGFAEVYALRAVGDQLGLSVAQLRAELAVKP